MFLIGAEWLTKLICNTKKEDKPTNCSLHTYLDESSYLVSKFNASNNEACFMGLRRLQLFRRTTGRKKNIVSIKIGIYSLNSLHKRNFFFLTILLIVVLYFCGCQIIPSSCRLYTTLDNSSYLVSTLKASNTETCFNESEAVSFASKAYRRQGQHCTFNNWYLQSNQSLYIKFSFSSVPTYPIFVFL